MKTTLASIIVVIGIAIAGYFLFRSRPEALSLTPSPSPSASISASATPTATPTPMDITKLEAQILVVGTGTPAKKGDKLSVLYKGTLINGEVFDASELHGNKPFEFTLGAGGVIAGWDQGFVGVKKGEKRKLFIPSELAYGPQGIPGSAIGPNADLIFEVEVVNITP